ncbi:hypothetical protein EYM_03715 [Ignicoccus islandicus DSM 13165]|uniref:Mn2+-dependent serine/threonine protein kinase n=1 Tax=Ignicoccus islandicus DSM 13165 TaxID=940295 RepID=A0A0U3EDD2_9CREN|nr:hypothetical protein [Ignicoccus islandicus]ALU12435.1 hypothetical protein EYM_03715 [Ignicoccus islandicus DSM 13165]
MKECLRKRFSNLLSYILSSLYQTTFSKHGEIKVVVKNFSTWTSIKWIPALIFLKGIYPYTISPIERVIREVSFFEYQGVPKVYFWNGKYEVREYVEGNIISLEDINKVINLVKYLHSKCWRIGDTKWDNFLKMENGKVILIDAEQAVVDCSQKSVIADALVGSIFLYYSKSARAIDISKLFFIEIIKGRCKSIMKYLFHPGVVLLGLLIPQTYFSALLHCFDELRGKK